MGQGLEYNPLTIDRTPTCATMRFVLIVLLLSLAGLVRSAPMSGAGTSSVRTQAAGAFPAHREVELTLARSFYVYRRSFPWVLHIPAMRDAKELSASVKGSRKLTWGLRLFTYVGTISGYLDSYRTSI